MTSTTSPTERVGRYQLLEPIGVGPSGAVSRAKVFGVAGFERQFAVKRFHAELTATAAMAAMLSAAARAYGSLEHPRIARMSEFGVAQGSTFTAVEYVQGLDALRLIGEARLAGVTLAVGGALALVSQAARAVGYAHGRGLTHLGLAPTNVIVTAEGDIKITDFGILSATLPQRPTDTPRLAQRIPYLAPEQLANEPTSAATDVFALGVLAHELITGDRAFKGDTPQQIAAAIMAGPPAEPALPRPIVRVLSRCLARSPFERFPDARALADALDAALRVAPVPGTRKDIGAQVKETLDRLAALNEGQMSGVVALHLGTGPIRRTDDDVPRRAATQGRDAGAARDPGGPITVAGGPVTVGGPVPTGASEPGATLQDLPRSPMTTVPGLAPPPIPIPAGVGPPATPPPATPPSAGTLIGMGKSPPAGIPPIKPRPGSVSGLPPARPPAVPSISKRAGTRPGTDLSIRVEPPPAASMEIPVETIDPEDLVPLDSGLVNVVELDALADAPSGKTSSPPAESAAPPSHAAVTTSLRQARPLDENSIDTRPSELVEPESLLLEPIDQIGLSGPPTRPIMRPSQPRLSPDEDAEPPPGAEANEFDTAESPRALPRAMTPPEARAPAAGIGVSAQTIIGVGGAGGAGGVGGAGAPKPRAATPPPPAQVPPAVEHHEPSGDDADATRDGFRAAGPQHDDDADATRDGFRAAGPQHDDDADATRDDFRAAEPPLKGSREPANPQPALPAQQPPAIPPGWVSTPRLPEGSPEASPEVPGEPRPRRRIVWGAFGVLAAVIAGVGAWQVYLRLAPPAAPHGGGSARVAVAPSDAQAAAPPADAAQVAVAPPADAAQVATTTPDAAQAAAATPDAAQVAATTPDAATPPSDARPSPADAAQTTAITQAVPSSPSDALSIVSTPPGARVFLDGADTGATPLKLPGSPDRHTIALLLAGHELYVAQVDGHGAFQIPLKEVTPTNGPAGIKVVRCKDKDRYYVFIDGKPTGQTCPTERIGCEVGKHTVEVYDVVSETRRKWDIEVKDTRLSFRVRVE